jgi:hypothetical protein
MQILIVRIENAAVRASAFHAGLLRGWQGYLLGPIAVPLLFGRSELLGNPKLEMGEVTEDHEVFSDVFPARASALSLPVLSLARSWF